MYSASLLCSVFTPIRCAFQLSSVVWPSSEIRVDSFYVSFSSCCCSRPVTEDGHILQLGGDVEPRASLAPYHIYL
ncbi:hypothetical protein R3P38DRAFT_2990967 [Favolaschia claudopus]|uniref:Secreted protein n=1 Tax=Favolaschia claudopus TaxID=2862362 RepID=A0AAW0AUM9_9AGAR